jgi:hypothetical protein
MGLNRRFGHRIEARRAIEALISPTMGRNGMKSEVKSTISARQKL